MPNAESIAASEGITSIMLIVDTTKQSFDTAKDVDSLPSAFREVAARFPIVCEVLNSVKRDIEGEGGKADDDSYERTWTIVKGCEFKALELKKLFHQIIPANGLPRTEKDFSSFTTLGIEIRVETLMKDLLVDVQLLAVEYGIFVESDQRDIQLVNAIKEMTALPALFSGFTLDEPGSTALHSGPGHIYQSQGSQFVNPGSGHIYNAQSMTFESSGSDRTSHDDRHIMAWLSPLNFWTKQADLLSIKEEGTGEWILRDPVFREWVDGTERMLWCPGMPGAGKTILACTVVDYLQKSHEDKDIALGFLYCNYKDRTNQSPQNLVAALVQQFLQQQRQIPTDFHLLYKEHFEKQTRPSVAKFSSLLSTLVSTWSKVYIVVDALDECDETTRGYFVSILLSLPKNTIFMVTSRNIPIIGEELRPYRRLHIRASDIDIRRYLEGRIERATRLRCQVQADPFLHRDMISGIMDRTEGMFLLARLHIEALERKNNLGAIREALKHLPRSFDETYDHLMTRILDQYEDDVLLAERILCWLLYSTRPLDVRELQEAVAIRVDDHRFDDHDLCDITTMLSVCAGLVEYDEESNVFRLVHQTTQEYFERKHSELFLQGQTILARACLAYLSSDALKIGGVNRYLDIWDQLQVFPLLRYALLNLGFHYLQAKEVIDETEFSNFLAQEEKASCCLRLMKSFSTTYQRFNKNIPLRAPKLIAAAAFGLQKTVQALLARGADVNSRDTLENTALHFAALGDNEDLIRMLLKKGADVDIAEANGHTALYIASVDGHSGAVRALLEWQASTDAPPGFSASLMPLRQAAYHGHEGVVREMLQKGVCTASNRDKALHQAIANDQKGVVRLLVQIESTINGDILADLVWGGDLSMALLLLEGNVDLTTNDFASREDGQRAGQRALHHAIRQGHEGIARALLQAGADIEGYHLGQTPLQVAASFGHAGIVQALLERGAIIETANLVKGPTALGLATEEGHTAIVRLLLEKGAATGAYDTNGNTALHIAILNEYQYILQVLLDGGAAVDTPNMYGQTALHLAAEKGFATAVQILLDVGASTTKSNREGRTALQIAFRNGHDDVAQLLRIKSAMSKLPTS